MVLKSEKARQRLHESFTLNSYIGIDGKAAFEAVELAEQEAEERMREELTRWHDPGEQPDDGSICLLKFQSNGFFVHYEGGIFTKQDGEWHDSQNMFTYNRDTIIAWRPMYDN